jgi:SAM-dependent methyltransferase
MDSAIDLLAKHLPPSAAVLRLWALDTRTAERLRDARADVALIVPEPAIGHDQDSLDAVAGVFATVPDPVTLGEYLRALRPGGRLILLVGGYTARPTADETPAQAAARLGGMAGMLGAVGFVRLLAETVAVSTAAGTAQAVLVRGEKPHTTDDTHARVTAALTQPDARGDGLAEAVSLTNEDLLVSENPLVHMRGRFVFLLVRQTPDRPPWALPADEPLTWEAVAVWQGGRAVALAFSSLPAAVAFLQPAVLAGAIVGVNKVAKFTRAAAQAWAFQVVLDPTPDILDHAALSAFSIDPASAVTGEE